MIRIVASIALLVCIPSVVLGGPLIVTPAIGSIRNGRIECRVTNASPTKPLEVLIRFRNINGSSVGGGSRTVAPLATASSGISLGLTQVEQLACFVEILKGSKRNARVVVELSDDFENSEGIVQGQ